MCHEIVYIFVALVLPIRSQKIAVTVKQGTLIGTTEATIFDSRLYYAFYGVPYAQPPVGKLRFMNPKPAKEWNKPFDASTEYHGACAQAHIVHKHALYGFEDCLHLNIYTPQLQGDKIIVLKPVIVWIHGYAFTSSFSHIYGADFLIDNDVIFISVSHRIGAFGFLKMNETDSNVNMGLKDIVMALKWIRKNIKMFGGDKKKITVMANNSGATFVSLLLTTKHRKLFSKLILQSGALYSPSIFQGNPNLEYDRLSKQLENLMKASAKDVIAAAQKIYSKKEVINVQKPMVPFSPLIEKDSNDSLITRRPEDFYKNERNYVKNIPILIGFNSQESISDLIPFLHNPRFLKSLSALFKFMVPFTDGCRYNYTSKIYKVISEKIKKQYFKDGIAEYSIQDFLRYASDLYKYPVYKFIQSQSHTKNKQFYVYKFNYVGMFNAVKATSMAGVNINVKGAANGDEICYILKCEPLWQNYVKVSNDASHPDRKFIKQISEMWSNFAKSGDPTPVIYKGNITWLPMTSKDDNILLISKASKLIGSKLERNMFSFWNKLYDAYYSYENCDKNKHDEL